MRFFFLAAALSLAAPALAQIGTARPEPLAIPAAMPAPRDIPYPGTLRLEIDASDTGRGLYRAAETTPVAGPGPLTLLYPQWLPGNHGPSGPIQSLAGLRITPGRRPVPSRRDAAAASGRAAAAAPPAPPSVCASPSDGPAGVRELRLEVQHLSPTDPGQGRV